MSIDGGVRSAEPQVRVYAAAITTAALARQPEAPGSLRAFVSEIDRTSLFAQDHSTNVADLCVAIHRELGTPEEQIERYYLGALLHDIGKVGIDSSILGKPARLTAGEYEEIKRHPLLGADVVGSADHLTDIVPDVLYHHERIDGTGYPFQLVQDEIPLGARVLAVADSYDAMTSPRVYRQALNRQEAVIELVRSSGTQLCPVAVRALLAVLAARSVKPKTTSL